MINNCNWLGKGCTNPIIFRAHNDQAALCLQHALKTIKINSVCSENECYNIQLAILQYLKEHPEEGLEV